MKGRARAVREPNLINYERNLGRMRSAKKFTKVGPTRLQGTAPRSSDFFPFFGRGATWGYPVVGLAS